MIVEKSIARLKPEDRHLPQIIRIRELLSRGIAVHHGGLLPIVKEVVEILFAKTLVKVLFATETFAMGLNLPTRTVVFSGYRKHDGRQFRDLLPGEYTQMAGRAGRRGLDPVGSVIIVAPGAEEAPPAATLRSMILGDPTKLRSQFRLTYNMILNLLRVEALKIEEMIKRSFSENATQALLPEHEKAVKLGEADLAKLKREPCDICDIDLEACHEACVKYNELTTQLHAAVGASPFGKRMFATKRLIVFKKKGVRSAGMLVRDGIPRGDDPSLPVLEIATNKKKSMSDDLPYLGAFAGSFVPLPKKFADLSLKTVFVPLSDIECVTETIVKSDAPLKALSNKKEGRQLASDQLLPLVQSWSFQDWDEVNWRKIKDLTVQNLLDERKKIAEEAQNKKCLTCPKFLQHFTMQHDEWVIRENIKSLRMLMSDQNLQLLPDYEQRIEVLKELGFVDENSRVELKGKVACEVCSAPTSPPASDHWLTAWNRFTLLMNSCSLNLSSRTYSQTMLPKKSSPSSPPLSSRRRLMLCRRSRRNSNAAKPPSSPFQSASTMCRLSTRSSNPQTTVTTSFRGPASAWWRWSTSGRGA